jgi:hypothetical protein
MAARGDGGRGFGRGRGDQRGSGGGGRGGAAQFRPLVAELPTLDFKLQDTSFPAEKVENFMEQMELFSSMYYDSNVKQLFLPNAVYTVPVPPARPAENSEDKYVFELWKDALRIASRKAEKFQEDIIKLAGVIKAQLSSGSKERIERAPGGKAAMDGYDPLAIIKLIRLTHCTGGRNDPAENLDLAMHQFGSVKMHDREELSIFYDRYQALYNGVVESATRAGVPGRIPDDTALVLAFLRALNGTYNRYKLMVHEQVRPKPVSVQALYEDLSMNFVPDKTSAAKIFAAGITRENEGRPRKEWHCSRCKSTEHLRRNCPQPPKTDGEAGAESKGQAIDRAITEEKSSGGGKKAAGGSASTKKNSVN